MGGGVLARFCDEPDASTALVVELGTGAAEDDILFYFSSFSRRVCSSTNLCGEVQSKKRTIRISRPRLSFEYLSSVIGQCGDSVLYLRQFN